MSRGVTLALRPELCDRCARCVRACPRGAVKVGGGYIYVDAAVCDSCGVCADTCVRGAITRAKPSRPIASPGGVGKVVVGSRAEAKSLRKSAAAVEKAAVKATAKATPGHGRASAKPATSARPGTAPTAAGETSTGGAVAWTAGDAVAVLAVVLAAFVAKEAVVGSSAVTLMPAGGQVAARALALGAFYAAQLGAMMFLAHRRGATLPSAFGLTRAGNGGGAISAALVIGLLVVTRGVALGWGAFAQAIGWSPPANAALTDLFGAGVAGFALTAVMVAVLGPVTEELVFRGVLLRAAADKWGQWPGIVLSAAVFAAYHVTPWWWISTSVLGVATGWLASTRRTLWPAIALHMLYNGVVIAAVFHVAR